MVSANNEVILEVQQLSKLGAMISPVGMVFILIGLLALVVGVVIKPLRKFMLPAVGVFLLSIGLLMQYGGAVLFFGFIGIIAGVLFCWYLFPMLKNLTKPAVTAAIVILSSLFFVNHADAAIRTVDETWKIKDERLQGEATIDIDTEQGEKVLILRAPATLTSFESETCTVARSQTGRGAAWFVVPKSPGLHKVVVNFEMRVPKLAENDWSMVTGKS